MAFTPFSDTVYFDAYKTALADLMNHELPTGYVVVAVVRGREEVLGFFTKRHGALDAAEYISATTIRGGKLMEVREALLAYGHPDEYVAVRRIEIPVFTRTGWYEVWQGDVTLLGRAYSLTEAQRLVRHHPDATEIVTPTGDVIEL